MYVVLLSLSACDPADTAGPEGTAFDPVQATEVWAIGGGAGSLAWDGAGLLATVELGDSVLRWDPETALDDEIGSRLGSSPLAVLTGTDGTVYLATTDSGVEGFVGVLSDPHTLDVLASDAGGVLFRRPVDLAWSTDGALLVADSGAEAVWQVPVDGGAAVQRHGGVAVQALSVHLDQVLLATDEGVLADSDDGLVEHASAVVRDLISWDGVLLGTTADGVVQVDDGALLVGLDAGRPSALARAGEILYVADESGGRVWAADLSAFGD